MSLFFYMQVQEKLILVIFAGEWQQDDDFYRIIRWSFLKNIRCYADLDWGPQLLQTLSALLLRNGFLMIRESRLL